MAKQLTGIWQRVDTLVGMMHATRMTRSATSILTFQAGTNLRQLAETVHTLRLSLGHRAHIVVQEKGASLRYQNEALLLRLGVNLVIHKDVLTSRLPLLLESLRGQVFNRDVDINFEAALASVTPTRLRGYILPMRFTREVDLILDRAETLNIPCAMIIGRPTEDLTMIDILMQINLSRSGDLITADNEFCYLFLNACPQTVLLATLERLLGRSVETAMNDVRFLIQRSEINSELLALSRAADRGTLPDYSSLSESIPPAEPAAADRPETTSMFAQSSVAQKVAAVEPIAQLLSAWAPDDSKMRARDDASVLTTDEGSPRVPQFRPGLAPPPVFGKKAAPRATRAS
ncbi:MAG: BcsE family c-di-GMP-binding protein [Rhodoferax sp.]